jgi:outer membrane autotransporter protein
MPGAIDPAPITDRSMRHMQSDGSESVISKRRRLRSTTLLPARAAVGLAVPAQSGLARPGTWCFFLTVLASVLLTSKAARSQDIGPGPITSTIFMGPNRTVVGSTQWTPPSGSIAANVGGPGTLIFNPDAGPAPGPITLSTENARAIVITGSGQLSINPNGSPFITTITTTGMNAHAIDVVSGQHTQLLNNVAITTSGMNSDGIRIENPNDTINATDVTLTTTGPGASALALISGGASTASFTNSTLQSEAGPAIRVVSGVNKNITLTGTSVTAGSGDGRWLYVTGGANPVNITASGSTLEGAAITDSGSISNATLQNRTLWTMTGNSNLTNLTNNASAINFTPPVGDVTQLASYKTLTVMNYTGAGGTLGMNTFLGTDGSPSDRLVVNGGTASGSTALRIANTTGLGDLTTGSGILVVDAINGATTDDAFRLAGPVVAGPYEYLLFKGNGNPEAWYLRSSIPCAAPRAPSPPCGVSPPTRPPRPPPPPPLPPPGPPPPPPPPGPPSPPPPPGPSPPVPPQVVVPNYRQEVSLYAAIPSLALLYGRNLMDTLHERVGEEEHLRGRARSNTLASGAWGRIIGQFGQRDGDRAGIFGSGPQFDYSVGAFQVGQDFVRWDNLDGSRDHAGLYVAAGLGEARVQHFNGLRAGDDTFNAASFGGYWTHFGPTGWYIDAIAQGTWYDMRGESTRRELSLNTDGFGFAGSLEAGHPFRLGGGFFIEPQAQIVYQTISFEDGRDLGATVRFRDVDSLAGRIGVRIARTFALDAGPQPRLMTAWLRPNLWREFRGDPKTEFSSETGFIPFRSDIGGTWFELDAGFSGEVAPNTALYANGSYQVSVDGKDNTAYAGKAGVRVMW